MKLFISMLIAMFAAVAFAAEPAYWMKSYPGADAARVQRCLAVADTAYAAAHNGGPGLNGWAVLAKGTAWEHCMERK